MTKSVRKKPTPKPLTTAQRLDGIIKSARKIMRKDKGLNGDLDRLPMLTWIMFLKFLDDLERIEEERAELAGRAYRGTVATPYRWRDWAAPVDGLTGPDLLAFLTDEQTALPTGTQGPGLFAYLRNLRERYPGRERRDVIATVFQGLANRMESGYLLRDVINLIDAIHFDSSDEIHTLGRLYETLLREMRDAAGDSGEFYTPRPVVQFMVTVTDPRLGETVLDPACGTGGFLVETYRHLERQADTVEKRKCLQEDSIYAGEAKSLPFLLAQMNLLLHGLDAPRIDRQLVARPPVRDRRGRAGERHPDQPTLWRRGGSRHSQQFPRRPAHRGNRAVVSATHHAPAQAGRAGSGRRGGAQWHPVRRRRIGAHQGRPAGAVQPAYRGPPARRRVRALHRYSDQPDFL